MSMVEVAQDDARRGNGTLKPDYPCVIASLIPILIHSRRPTGLIRIADSLEALAS